MHDNGKTSYELLKAIPYQDQLMDYGEQVLAKMNRETNKGRSDWIQGFWLGRTSISTEHLIHTSQGIVKSRTVRRVPLQDRWTSVELQLSGFPPWSPTKEKEREGGWKRSLEGEFMPEGLPGPSQRQGNANSRKLQLFYNQCGRTPGCTSCLQGTFGRHHSRTCVERQKAFHNGSLQEEQGNEEELAIPAVPQVDEDMPLAEPEAVEPKRSLEEAKVSGEEEEERRRVKQRVEAVVVTTDF